MPVTIALRPEERSQGLNNLRSWHVGYQLCDLKAEITVYAKDEVEARAKAVEQLRVRGLRVPELSVKGPDAVRAGTTSSEARAER